MTAIIRPPRLGDRAGWDQLFAAYAAFGGEDQTAEMRNRVWDWIHDPARQTICLVAEAKTGLVGFVHFRSYERPMPAVLGAYIDDMYVAPGARGQGIVDDMIWAVGDYARARGWDCVRWMTSETNARARAVYDRHADRTQWVTYELRGKEPGG